MGRDYKLDGREEPAPSRPETPKRGTFVLNEGQGSLFNNKHKKEGDNKPALVGQLVIEGKTYEVAVWKKKTRDGKGVWYSMSANLPDQTDAERPQDTPPYEEESQEPPKNFDEIPEY